jgi:hypothetical protein
MSGSNFPNGFAAGVTIRGLPLQQTHPGEVFWVNNSSVLAKGAVGGSNGNDGSYRRPFASITYALTKCTADRGDIIMVMPGYDEEVSGAGGEAWNVDGVAIVGLGSGAKKPTLTFGSGTAADSVVVTGDNMSVTNFRFVSELANLTNCVSVTTGTHFTLDSCEFMASAAGTGMNISLLTAATATGLEVHNCKFNMESTIAGVAVTDVPTEAIRLVGCDNAVIKGCTIVGNFSTSAINGITTASEGLLIDRNFINNVTTSAAAGGIDLVAACTGIICDNRIGSYETTNIDTVIDNAACVHAGNLIANVITEVGGIGGTAST